MRVEATRNTEWDLEGRILIHELSNQLVIINGYWVNGNSALCRNPVTGELDGDRHALKLRYHQHVLDEVLEYESRGRHVILVGDMNVARQRIDGYPNLRTSPQAVKNRYDFNQKFFHDEDRKKYTYWPKNASWGFSMDRVDLIISSRFLIERYDAIAETDICDNQIYRATVTTSHCGLLSI